MDTKLLLYQVRRSIVLAERAKSWQQRIDDRKAAVVRLNAIMESMEFLPINDIRRCDPRIYYA